ncbi:MAG: hypothetical protein K9N05_02505 [Candidatus Marinimicrobia bacterium]|nr:hypothetical protein [Candidatus Neomarinimicrobiota bacterium]
MTMIHQLLAAAKTKIDQVILNTKDVHFLAENLTSTKIPALIINNRLPIEDLVEMKDIQILRSKGVEYYPSGRTGMPALVTAEDGLALPGSLLATTDKNLLELAVLGTAVALLDRDEMLKLLNTGTLKLTAPKVRNIVLQGSPGEWISGIDIALYLIKYYLKPEDKHLMLEIHGEGLNALPLHERFNLARILTDLGYEHLLFQVDETVMAFLQDRADGEGHYYFPELKDDEETITIDIQKIHPMLAWKEKDKIKIEPLTDKDGQETALIFIGGDTSCRYADIETGLKLIRYTPLTDTVTACIMPGSQLVNGDLLDMGIAGILTEIGFDLLPSSFLELLVSRPDTKGARLGTSAQILHSGGMLANALSCFSAAMTGKITHPLELESILKQKEEHKHDHEHSE